jgi:hypothetical protein
MLKEKMKLASLLNEVVTDRNISNLRKYLVDSLAARLTDDASCIVEMNNEDFFEQLERVDLHYELGSVYCVSIIMTQIARGENNQISAQNYERHK